MVAWFSPFVLVQRSGFIGEVPWANFDGVHYLSIARNGYFQYEQAFFPFFPLLIKFLSVFFRDNALFSALLIVHICFFTLLVVLWKLVRLDFSSQVASWTIVFLLFFPTSFFFLSIYTESLFLLLTIGSFYAARKNKWLLASILGAFATSTRFVGIFLFPALIYEWWKSSIDKKNNVKKYQLLYLLLIPLGLSIYMMYLQTSVHDSFAFIHSQPAFGAGRSGGTIITLPQVLYRYIKILLTVPFTNYDVWVSLVELLTFFGGLSILIFFWKNVRISYTLFSLLALVLPTLSGTLSSMPRYVLVMFPLFIVFASIKSIYVKCIILFCSFLLLILLTSLFLRGYFVA